MGVIRDSASTALPRLAQNDGVGRAQQTVEIHQMGVIRDSASTALPRLAQNDGVGRAQKAVAGPVVSMSSTAGASTPPVFIFDNAAALTGLVPGDLVELTGAEGKHAQVQRLQPGEPLDVVDGRGLRLHCEVSESITGGLRLVVIGVAAEPSAATNIVLVQALAKADRDELAISTAVEVGVDQVQPWQADRSIVIWRADKAAKAKQRWVDAIRAATKQARRAWVPLVHDAVNSKQLAARIAAVVSHGGAAWVLDAAGTVTAATAELPNRHSARSEAETQNLQVPAPDSPARHSARSEAETQNLQVPAPELLIIVGPEGGISGTELNAFQQAGAQLVRLGSHIMRTSTAGPIAVALAAERLGRWDV